MIPTKIFRPRTWPKNIYISVYIYYIKGVAYNLGVNHRWYDGMIDLAQ